MENEIIYINIDKLRPHPKNPRKELGDITELADSIKKNGVMQNLTVIPDGFSHYMILIGHRRHAAAKEAGLSELPCRVVEDISEAEQIGIMLCENIQRNDLTIMEEVDGIQMMLDLGETVESVSETTGFSQSTVRRRLKIAELDRKTLEKRVNSDGFQLSLGDYDELSKIKDVKKRNEILDKSNSPSNLKWRVEQAVNEEKRQEALAELRKKILDAGAIELDEDFNRNDYKYVQSLSTYSLNGLPDADNLSFLEEYDEIYFYFTNYGSLYFYIPEKDDAADEDEEEQLQASAEREKWAEISRRRDVLKDLWNLGIKEIRDFVFATADDIVDCDEDIPKIWNIIRDAGFYFDADDILMEVSNPEEDDDAAWDRYENYSTYTQMLIAAYVRVKEDQSQPYDWNGVKYKTPNRLIDLYKYIKERGFSFTDEAIEQMLLGTHEFYEVKEESKDDE